MTMLDTTHDASLQSWVPSANAADTDFPVQNLPFGRFSPKDGAQTMRIGVAIGDQILDLRAAGLADSDDMHTLMSAEASERQALRSKISQGLRLGSAQQATWANALIPMAQATLELPCEIRDYTDFYTGIHHATAVGTLFRPDNPLLPNYKWVPIAYHGRSSSIGVSGQKFFRPSAQTRNPQEDAPVLRPTQRLDYELELGVMIGSGNVSGDAIPIARAQQHAFGLVLLNDWSARDVQAWEYQPLGPFLAKNFASTISPWIVTMEALAPFHAPWTRPAGDPQPLAYLDDASHRAHGAFDITLEVFLQTEKMRETGLAHEKLSSSNYRDAYWSVAQMIAHHTVNGCNLRAGDLLGTGTQSAPEPENAGSLLERTAGGRNPVTLKNGEQRIFLQDGDSVTMRAHCEREGFRRIGFGECEGTVLPARS
ncbi:MAG: fumarylacetoacetase [Pseudomonadota bacterium]